MDSKGKGKEVKRKTTTEEEEEYEETDTEVEAEVDWREVLTEKLEGIERSNELILKELGGIKTREKARFKWVQAIYGQLEEDRMERQRWEAGVTEELMRLRKQLESEAEESESETEEKEESRFVDMIAEEESEESEGSEESDGKDVEMTEG